MGIVGTLVKSAIEVNHKINLDKQDPVTQQLEQLEYLLKKAENTAFGKYYGFHEMLKSKNVIAAFQQEVPLHDYEQMQFWWKQQQKTKDVSWPGKPSYFALTSGTTGKKSKRIPITEELSESMKKVGVSLTSSLPNFDLPESLFESQVLMLSSSADLAKHKHGFLEGEISGINIHNFPDWYELFYRPGKDIAAINDWDKRVAAIAKEAPNWNIGAIAGIPSWVLMMLKEVIRVNKLNYIQDIWPNFQLFASGGVAFETYRKDFEKISNRDLTILDTYLASEGFFAYTPRPGTTSMKLALSHGYFYELIPFDDRGVNEHGEILENPEIISLSEIERDQEYVLIISSCAGAWRYKIGDTIKFTDTATFEFKITGRTKFFLNVVGSQLSEEKMDETIIDLANELNVSINEYMVSAVKNEEGEYIHQWVLVSNDTLNENEVVEKLDQKLKERNNNYAVAREKALKGIALKIISKEQYSNYLEKTKKKGGQVKTPKVMKATKMKKLLDVLD